MPAWAAPDGTTIVEPEAQMVNLGEVPGE